MTVRRGRRAVTERWGRAAVAGLGVAASLGLSGCVDRSPTPAATSGVVRTGPTAATTATTVATTSGAISTTTSALPGTPVPTASGPSPVDSSTITSLGSLPAAFRCPAAPSPITIPAVTPPAAGPTTTSSAPTTTNSASTTTSSAPTAPAPTTATAPIALSPAAVVCPSPLAGGEALYLWYAPTPELKLAALTAALTQTKYVHAGPNWVAGGTVNPAMGTVGGEVYR